MDRTTGENTEYCEHVKHSEGERPNWLIGTFAMTKPKEKKQSTLEADRERLLDALLQLRKQGVTLIDDSVGRPVVVPSRVHCAPAELVNQARGAQKDSSEPSSRSDTQRLFIQDTEFETNPYNRRLK